MAQEVKEQSNQPRKENPAAESASQKPQSETKLTLGYNGIQLGLTPQEFGETKRDYRLRVYSNVGVENSDLHVRFQGLNERGVDYSFGRNSLRAGANKFPVDVVVAARYAGVGEQNAGLIDVGVGVRVDLARLPFVDYGFADLLKHSGLGRSGYAGPELVTFWGKQVGPATIESTMAKKSGNPLFVEVEVLLKPVTAIKGTGIRPFARSESFDFGQHTFTAGFQLQFPARP